jgi:hypothetical protein
MSAFEGKADLPEQVLGYAFYYMMLTIESGGGTMSTIDRTFVVLGLAWLVLGMLVGLQMGATGSNQYLLVHVAMLMGGFVLLTFYGLIHRAWPALRDSGLALPQFWTAAIGPLITVIGTALIVNGMGMAVALVGSLLDLIGAILMCLIFWNQGKAAS